MRKWIMAVLCALALTGCGAVVGAEQAPLQQIAAQTALAKPLTYRVDSGVSADAAQAEDGTPLVCYRFQLPRLQVLRADGSAIERPSTARERKATAVADTFNTHFEKWTAAEEFPSIVESAREDLAACREWGSSWMGPYEMDLSCAVYQTEGLVSVAGTYYSYTGGAHPNAWHLSWNFDLENGEFFGPEGLAADSVVFQQAMVEELVRQAGETAAENGLVPEEMFWMDYESILANWSSCAVFFDEGGMHVVFSPYELAAYGFGEQDFFLSYDWLRPYLSDHGRDVLGLTEE